MGLLLGCAVHAAGGAGGTAWEGGEGGEGVCVWGEVSEWHVTGTLLRVYWVSGCQSLGSPIASAHAKSHRQARVLTQRAHAITATFH